MTKLKMALCTVLFLLFMRFNVSAEPFSGTTEVVSVKDGDTFYQISLLVYTDEERSRGASWFAIYDFNVDLGSIKRQKTPIVLGLNGLHVYIIVNQKLVIPHYLGAFPTPESVTSRFGVQTSDGSLVEGFVPAPMSAPALAEPLAEPVAEVIVEINVEPEALSITKPKVEPIVEIEEEPVPEPLLEPVTEPAAEPVSEVVVEMDALPLPEPVLEPASEPAAEQVAEVVVELDVEPEAEPVNEVAVEPVTGPSIEPTIEPEAATEPVTEQVVEVVSEPVAEPIIEPIAEPLAVVSPEIVEVEKQSGGSVFDKLETFVVLGIGFYGDSLGFNAEAGMQCALGEKFDIDSWLGNAIVGVSFLYDGVVRDEILVTVAGGDLRAGYRFMLADYFPALPDSLDLRLTPSLIAGPVYQGIERSGRFIYQGLALHLAPVVTLDVSPFKDGTFKPLRAGLSFGYHFYFSTVVLQNLHAGLSASWTL